MRSLMKWMSGPGLGSVDRRRAWQDSNLRPLVS